MSDLGFYGETICAIGVFDGMHLGHQYLLKRAREQADEMGLPLLVVTFDCDPDELFFPDRKHRKLLSDSERLYRLKCEDNGSARGISQETNSFESSETDRIVLALHFDHDLASLTPVDFLNRVVASHCIPRGIHVGIDFRFGAGAQGNVEVLRQWAATHNAQAHGHHLFDDGGRPVSATRIRNCLEDTKLAEANRLLTRPHHLRGRIVKGRGFGREMGFPTANIAVLDGIMPPADGVYAGFFEIGGDLQSAAISVGVPLTFEGLEASLEVYVLDFDDDLYEKEANIYFVEHLRPMIAFPGVPELMDQIGKDVMKTREVTTHARELFN
ncbi:MAG: riboflavin biosynthesis protein RibF [Coriobacteriales bacterium]|jgi:riboflavin kinase/FMN adenylyltransferase|nr:riboflavin biosynthesis protein RibF [Coriobacteriales bacterium]